MSFIIRTQFNSNLNKLKLGKSNLLTQKQWLRRVITTKVDGQSTSKSNELNQELHKNIQANEDLNKPIAKLTETNLLGDIDTLRWNSVAPLTAPSLIKHYQGLSKAKLAGLVTLSTMAGYAIAPGATNVATLLFTTLGTGLCIASANTFNQWVESPYDAQMARTRTRVLVKHSISPLHAFSVGVLSGGAGVGMLLNYVNPTVAYLGLFNIILYSGIYTPMKRYHIANTWVGSIVGAIPPIMGWAACTGSVDMPSYLLALLMYAWQFPHFNSLAWNLRSDYAKAGYQMMSVTNPPLNSRVSLRYSLALIPISIAFPLCNLTSWWFALDSNLVNLYMLIHAWRFHKSNDDKSARSLFFSSLIHLPLIFALMLIHKQSSDKPVTYEEFIKNCKSALNYLKGVKDEQEEKLLE